MSRYSKSWTQALEEVQEQTGVRKVDFVDGVTPDIQEEKCPDCGKEDCECKAEEVKEYVKNPFEYEASDSKGMRFVVKKRTKPGDKFSMMVIDKNSKMVKDWGSHPSLDGAKKFGKNKGFTKVLDGMQSASEDVKEHCGECGAMDHIDEKMDGRKKNSGKQAKKDNEDRRAAKRKELGILGPNEETISEADYELYHKDFSSAMQHAYKHAKKQGFTVDPEEIDNKVATGPRKPSKGKTNRYILGTDKKKNVHIQVANLDNKKFELNMYIEETEKENMDLDQTIKQVMEGKVKKEDSDKSEPGTQGDDAEYAKKRDAVLKKYGVKACGECESEEEKKACFKDLDDAHVADHEEEVKKEDKEYGPSSTDAGKSTKAKGKVGKDKLPLKKYEENKSPLYNHIKNLLRNR